jgi:hypothetical protein
VSELASTRQIRDGSSGDSGVTGRERRGERRPYLTSPSEAPHDAGVIGDPARGGTKDPARGGTKGHDRGGT